MFFFIIPSYLGFLFGLTYVVAASGGGPSATDSPQETPHRDGARVAAPSARELVTNPGPLGSSVYSGSISPSNSLSPESERSIARHVFNPKTSGSFPTNVLNKWRVVELDSIELSFSPSYRAAKKCFTVTVAWVRADTLPPKDTNSKYTFTSEQLQTMPGCVVETMGGEYHTTMKLRVPCPTSLGFSLVLKDRFSPSDYPCALVHIEGEESPYDPKFLISQYHIFYRYSGEIHQPRYT